MAKHTHKFMSSARLLSLANVCNHETYDIFTGANIEGMIAQLRYYDPSAPGTLVTADASTGTYSRDISLSGYAKMHVRNNYQVPACVKIYLCKVKGQTANSPTALLTANDQVIGGSGVTEPLVFLTEIETITQQWNVDCVLDKTLEPGQEATVTHSIPKFHYDPSHVDSDSATYQKLFHGCVWVVRVEGVLGHDTVASEQARLASGIDIEKLIIAKIEYDAGVALNDIYLNDQRPGSFSTGAVVSLKPVADNIAYSVT